MLGVHSVDHSCGNVTLFTTQFPEGASSCKRPTQRPAFGRKRPRSVQVGSRCEIASCVKIGRGMMAARPRCGEAKKVAKGTGIMALTANARLPRNKKSGLQFLIAAKDRGFPQRGGVSGHLRPRIGLTGGSKNDEFGSICWADKTHPLSSCLPHHGLELRRREEQSIGMAGKL